MIQLGPASVRISAHDKASLGGKSLTPGAREGTGGLVLYGEQGVDVWFATPS